MDERLPILEKKYLNPPSCIRFCHFFRSTLNFLTLCFYLFICTHFYSNQPSKQMTGNLFYPSFSQSLLKSYNWCIVMNSDLSIHIHCATEGLGPGYQNFKNNTSSCATPHPAACYLRKQWANLQDLETGKRWFTLPKTKRWYSISFRRPLS